MVDVVDSKRFLLMSEGPVLWFLFIWRYVYLYHLQSMLKFLKPGSVYTLKGVDSLPGMQ